MPEVEIKVLHLQGLRKASQKASKDFGDKMEAALWKAGFAVEVPAVQAARDNFLHPTGNLPSSLHTEVSRQGLIAKVGTNLEYARLRELGGTIDRAWGRATTVHRGRPYLIPAFERARPKIKEIFSEMLKNITTQIADETRQGM